MNVPHDISHMSMLKVILQRTLIYNVNMPVIHSNSTAFNWRIVIQTSKNRNRSFLIQNLRILQNEIIINTKEISET